MINSLWSLTATGKLGGLQSPESSEKDNTVKQPPKDWVDRLEAILGLNWSGQRIFKTGFCRSIPSKTSSAKSFEFSIFPNALLKIR